MPVTARGVVHDAKLGDVPYEVSEDTVQYLLSLANQLEALVPTTKDVLRIDRTTGHRIELTHRGSVTVQAVCIAVRNRNERCTLGMIWSLILAAMFILVPVFTVLMGPNDSNPIPGSRIVRSIALGFPFLWGAIYLASRQISHKLLIADAAPDFDVTPDGYLAQDGEKYTPERRKADVEVYCAQIRHLLPKKAHLAEQIMREYESRGK